MIGESLSGRYEIVRELGRGGMGVVYLAHDPVLDREVAIKVVPGDRLTPEAEARLQREARLVARLDHPGIIAVYDFARHADSVFFVMPVVRGDSLRSILRERPLPLGDTLAIGAQVADALHYSHASGVVHRDIKPENVMVLRDGSQLRAKVMDFGIAVARSDTRITRAGMIVGTLAYLSPEQLRGKPIDARSDVYSLGVVLYECLAGRPPFDGNWEALLFSIVHDPTPTLRELGVEVPAEVESLVMRCLAKAPADRLASAQELADSLRRLSGRPALASLPAPAATPARPPLIGRERELSELVRRLQKARAGQCQLVVVGGETGLGKSRLLEELAAVAAADGVRSFRGRFVERLDPAFPYQGFCEVVQESLRSRPTGDPERPDLGDLMGDLVSLFPMLAEAPQAPGSTGAFSLTGERPLPSFADEREPRAENKTAVFELLARTLARIAGGRPLVVLFEDLHAADVSLEALQYVFRRLAAVPVLLAATYNLSEAAEGHPLARALRALRGDVRFGSVTLAALGPADHEKLARAVAAGRELDPEVIAGIHELTEGNPLFVVETVRSLADSTGAAGGDGGLLPSSVQQVVQQRLDRLADDARALLGTASVLGLSFDTRDLEPLADTSDVERTLDGLIERGHLVEEPRSHGQRLSFTSRLMREVVYQGLTARRRRALHRRYAELLERRHGGRSERVAHLLSRHFAEGSVPDKAVRYSLLAAENALQALVPEDAVRFAQTALSVEDGHTLPRVHAEARLLLARAHAQAGRVDETLAAVEEAVRDARASGSADVLIASQLLAAETAWKDCRIEETKRWSEEGARSAREAGDTDAQGRFLRLAEEIADSRGGVSTVSEPAQAAGGAAERDPAGGEEALPHDRMLHAEYLGVEESYREASRHEGSPLSPAAEAAYMLRLSRLSRQLGRYAEALEWCEQGAERFAAQVPGLAAELGAHAAVLCVRFGRLEAAAQHLARARGWLEAAGTPEAGSERALLDAETQLALARGDAASAMSAAEAAVGLSAYTEAAVRLDTMLLLAEARAAAGDHAGARQAIDAALVERGAEHAALARAGLTRTAMLLAEGDHDGALEEAQASLSLASEVRDPWLLCAVRLLLGRCRLGIGDVEDAEEEFLRVTRDATRTGTPLHLFEAQVGLVAVNRLRGRLLAAEVAARIALELGGGLGSAEAPITARLALAEVLLAAGQPREAREQLDAAAQDLSRWPVPHRVWTVRRAMVCTDLALRRYAEALTLAQQVAGDASSRRVPCQASRAWRLAGEAALGKGDVEAARTVGVSALREALVAGAPGLAADAYDLLARAALRGHRPDDAGRHARAGTEAAMAVGADGSPRRAATAQLRAAAVAQARGDALAVREALGLAIRILRDGCSGAGQAEGYCEAATLLAIEEPEQAQALLLEARRLAAAADYPACEARALGLLGELAVRAGRLNEAVELLRSEGSVRELAGAAGEQRASRVRLAWAYHAFGDLRQAMTLLAAAESGDLPPDLWSVRELLLRGRVLTERAEFAEAAAELERARGLALELGAKREAALVHREQAEWALAHGDLLTAGRELAAAALDLRSLGTRSDSQLGLFLSDLLELSSARAALLAHRVEEARTRAQAAAAAFRTHRCTVEGLDARLVSAEAELLAGQAAALVDVQAVVEEARALGLTAIRCDALTLLARVTREPAAATEAHRAATDLDSPARIAVTARLLADCHARAGHPAEAVRATTLAARVLARLRDLSPKASRGSALLFWESRARVVTPEARAT